MTLDIEETKELRDQINIFLGEKNIEVDDRFGWTGKDKPNRSGYYFVKSINPNKKTIVSIAYWETYKWVFREGSRSKNVEEYGKLVLDIGDMWLKEPEKDMIDIDGKLWSKSSIKEALKNHANFEEKGEEK